MLRRDKQNTPVFARLRRGKQKRNPAHSLLWILFPQLRDLATTCPAGALAKEEGAMLKIKRKTMRMDNDSTKLITGKIE